MFRTARALLALVDPEHRAACREAFERGTAQLTAETRARALGSPVFTPAEAAIVLESARTKLADATPLPAGFRAMVCIEVSCATCGETFDNQGEGFTQHFTSPEEAASFAESCDWVPLQGGRVACSRSCADDAEEPEAARYPAAIGVFCDRCANTFEGDFVVSDDMDQAARFEAARAHLRREGWSCTPSGDLCPACTTATTEADRA